MTPSDHLSGTGEAAVAGRAQLIVDGIAVIVAGLAGAGLTRAVTGHRCDSSPPGESSNPEFTFSRYCRALHLHAYYPPASGASGLANLLWMLPVTVAIVGTIIGLRRRRRTDFAWAFAMIVGIVALSLVAAFTLAHRTFHGV